MSFFLLMIFCILDFSYILHFLSTFSSLCSLCTQCLCSLAFSCSSSFISPLSPSLLLRLLFYSSFPASHPILTQSSFNTPSCFSSIFPCLVHFSTPFFHPIILFFWHEFQACVPSPSTPPPHTTHPLSSVSPLSYPLTFFSPPLLSPSPFPAPLLLFSFCPFHVLLQFYFPGSKNSHSYICLSSISILTRKVSSMHFKGFDCQVWFSHSGTQQKRT